MAQPSPLRNQKGAALEGSASRASAELQARRALAALGRLCVPGALRRARKLTFELARACISSPLLQKEYVSQQISGFNTGV